MATYPERARAAADFEAAVPDGHVVHGAWQIVLQTRSAIHWLHGNCDISADQFREVYGGAVDYAAGAGGSVEQAYLCECRSACRRVAVDR